MIAPSSTSLSCTRLLRITRRRSPPAVLLYRALATGVIIIAAAPVVQVTVVTAILVL
jgi:hypothetical protein